MKRLNATREEWLREIVVAARPMFESVSHPLPENVRASIGPSAKRTVLGVCYNSACSADKGREIFVSPTIVEPLRLADVLVHELCHSALPDGTAHKAPFAKLAKRMHLEGKPTSTTGGEEFRNIWQPIVVELGPYPGVEFDPGQQLRKQSTRMIKAECLACGFVFRTARKWIDGATDLRCPRHACNGQVNVELPDDG